MWVKRLVLLSTLSHLNIAHFNKGEYNAQFA